MSEFLIIMRSEAHWMTALCGLVAASGFFSSSESALFSLSQEELRAFRMGRPRERMAAELLGDPDRLLSAILFLSLTTNLLYFAVTWIVTQKMIEAGQWALAGAFGIGCLITILVLGEVLPKSLAALFHRRWARTVSWPLAAMVRLLDFLVPKLAHVARIVRRTFWPHLKQEPYLNADDLERAVEEASKLSPDIIRRERQLLHNILDLSEITVEEVMRPRGTYFSANSPLSLKAFQREVPPGDYVAIYAKDADEIQKAVPLASFTQFPTQRLDAASEAVPYVPWCADLAHALQLLREQSSGLAAVVNEYGETIGIVLAEDILDRVFLAQPSRARRLLEREPVLEVSPGVYHVEGITTLRFLCKRLGMEYDPDEEDFVTVVGMMHEELEHLPAIGDACQWRGYTVKVIELIGRGRVRVMLTKIPKPEAKPRSTSK